VSLAIVEDITERRATEQALARANERYRTLVETIPAVSYVWEFGTPPAETALYYTSPQIETLLGFTPEEWGADPDFWISRLHPDDRDAVLEAADVAERTGAPYRMECRYLATDGRVVWVQDEAVMIARRDDGSPWLYQGVMMDITARKGVEEELRSTSAYLRAIVDSSPVAIVSMDLDGTVRSWNEGAERIFGWTEEEAVGRFLPHVGPEHRAEFEALRDRLLEGRSSHVRVEIRRRRKDGSPVDLAQSFAPLRDALGRVTGMVAIQEDVTEQKRSRAQAAEVEERYRTLVEQIPAVTFVDEIVTVGERVEFTTVYVSPQVETMLGYDRGRYAAERMWATILHPLDAEPILRAAAEHVDRREPIDTEYRLVAADGRIVWVREQSMPLPQRTGRMFWQGVLYDITATKETELMLRNSEAELQRSLDVLRRTDEERRELLAHLMTAENLERGRMAEGIEDDSLQHMTAVGLRLESLRRRLTDPEHVGAVDQLGETVEQALSRLRSVLVELRPRSLELDGLGQALRQFAREAARDRDVRVDVEDRLGSQPDLEVRSLAYRIAQEAISNAVSWSRGTRVDVLVEERDGGVSIRVEDDGVGFEAETLDPATAIGVTSMTERAEVAGGWLRIGPGAGGGAVVECWLPGGVLGRSVDSAV
jgi:PAS domain S-box-containing protein